MAEPVSFLQILNTVGRKRAFVLNGFVTKKTRTYMKQHSVFLQGILLTACLGVAQAQVQQSFSPGFVKCEVYRNIASGAISDLLAFTNYPANPDEVHYLTALESPPMRYVPDEVVGYPTVGERVSGYIVPDETTNYIFYMGANTNGQLWIATDLTQPTDLQQIVTVHGDYPSKAYETNSPSDAVALQAGQEYYFEAYMASDGKHVDLMAVTWTVDTVPPPVWGAAPISGQFLGVFTDTDTVPPTAVTNLAVSPSAVDINYLWLTWTAPSDPGHTNPAASYDVRYSTQAINSNNWAGATPLDTTFLLPSPGGSNETFEAANLSPNTTYYFAVRSKDIAGNVSQLSNVAQGRTLAAVFSPGFLKLEVWYNVQGVLDYDLQAFPKYPNSPDEVHYVSSFEIPYAKYISGNTGGTPEGERLSGFIVPDRTAGYIFYMSANYAGELWLSTNADPANLQLIAQGDHDVLPRSYDLTYNSVSIPLVAGRQYYFEALQKSTPEDQPGRSGGEVGRSSENMAVTWTLDTEPSPQSGADPISGQFLGMLTAADTTPPAAVTNLALGPNQFGATHLFLQWSAPGEPGATNPVASYDLRYSTQPITSNNWASATPVDTAFTFGLPAGTTQSFKVGSLTPTTTYYFAIRSQDAAGNVSQLSNIASGQSGSYVDGMDLTWDLEFNVAGADPTAYGDWISRFGSLPAGTTWANLVTNGWLTVPPWNPILDTRPYDNFVTPFIIQERCRCLDVVSSPSDAASGWSGANFFVNMDTRDDGYYSQFSFALELLTNNTQQLTFNIDNVFISSADLPVTNLSTDFHVIRVEVDTTNMQFTTYVDGANIGTNPYTRNMNGNGYGNNGPYATILGWGYTAQWDYVQIGLPAPPSPPTLQFSQSGRSLAISWPVTATGYTLQETASLSPPKWSPAGVPTVQGDMNVFTTTMTGAMQFYRLSQ